MNLFKFVAPEFIFGSGSLKYSGQTLKNIGADSIYIVTDKTVKELNWFHKILDSISAAGLSYTIYDEVSENPKDYECEKGKSIYLEKACDVILAVGGGSVMDCAKAIAILIQNPSPIELYEGVDEIHFPVAPLVCIPTTSGSAAEISQFAIITNSKKAYKMAIVSKMIVPDFAIIDPETTLTKEYDLTVNTGLDVLAHALESYMSNAASPVTCLHSMEAIKLVLSNLKLASENLQDISYREKMMLASVHAGLAFSNASLGLIHAMAHALGGRYNLTHGELNGQLLSAVLTYNTKDKLVDDRELVKLFQDKLAINISELPELVDFFIQSIRPNEALPDIIFENREINDLLPFILNDPCIVTNPVDVTAEGIRWLYEYIQKRQSSK